MFLRKTPVKDLVTAVRHLPMRLSMTISSQCKSAMTNSTAGDTRVLSQCWVMHFRSSSYWCALMTSSRIQSPNVAKACQGHSEMTCRCRASWSASLACDACKLCSRWHNLAGIVMICEHELAEQHERMHSNTANIRECYLANFKWLLPDPLMTASPIHGRRGSAESPIKKGWF